MSTPNSSARKSAGKRLEAPDILKRKGAEPLVSLTAYTAPMARLVDQVADIIIIGDSMGMVLYGLETTLAMPLFTMIGHARAVVDASCRALCVFDMPFGSYEEGPEQAFRNAARVMKKTGVQAVKLEGGADQAGVIEALVTAGIPVMAHVGLRPQNVRQLGGYKVQRDKPQLMRDAQAAQQAGAFSIVLECIPEGIAAAINMSGKGASRSQRIVRLRFQRAAHPKMTMMKVAVDPPRLPPTG
ncbi:MAG: 3-methyl-2-oxobutanoate hydroxymethyltransferase [Proteobacteria bacterium]|nr:3-methyl-2-oxobutanoate hydroxymethyltransferase [Pseudomonadota bacterium]